MITMMLEVLIFSTSLTLVFYFRKCTVAGEWSQDILASWLDSMISFGCNKPVLIDSINGSWWLILLTGILRSPSVFFFLVQEQFILLSMQIDWQGNYVFNAPSVGWPNYITKMKTSTKWEVLEFEYKTNEVIAEWHSYNNYTAMHHWRNRAMLTLSLSLYICLFQGEIFNTHQPEGYIFLCLPCS